MYSMTLKPTIGKAKHLSFISLFTSLLNLENDNDKVILPDRPNSGLLTASYVVTDDV